MENFIYSNSFVKVESEPFEIPWVKIFTQKPIKEFSQCDSDLQFEILKMVNIVEKEMLKYFSPNKINIASFGNYVPYVHFHVQARFKEDSYFPESTWGTKQRDAKLDLDLDTFYKHLHDMLMMKEV